MGFTRFVLVYEGFMCVFCGFVLRVDGAILPLRSLSVGSYGSVLVLMVILVLWSDIACMVILGPQKLGVILYQRNLFTYASSRSFCFGA